MEFQNPKILYFLFAIGIPIIIHLFNLRKEKSLYFSNIKFLKEIKHEKRRRKTLKQLLILLTRILTIISIVLAFSNPYFKNNKKNNHFQKNTVIYIDNSFSMNQISNKGRLLDIAKEKSLEIIKNHPETQEFFILTNNFNKQENVSMNKHEARNYILSITTSPIIRTTEEIIKKQNTLSENSSIYILSDLQKISTDTSIINQKDKNNSIYILPTIIEEVNNVSIDSCWISGHINYIKRKVKLNVKLKNYSLKTIKDINVSLKINNRLKTSNIVSIKAKTDTTVSLTFELEDNQRIHAGEIHINDGTLSFDNTLFFSITLENSINVAQIYDETENKYINTLFSTDNVFNYDKVKISNLIYSELQDKDLLIINEINYFDSGFNNFISNYLNDGGSIAIIPMRNANIKNYNTFLSSINCEEINNESFISSRISSLNTNHDLFKNTFKVKKLNKNLDLPNINYSYTLKRNLYTIKDPILLMETGEPFLNHYKKNNGKIYLFTSPITSQNNNLYKHPLFVTIFFNMSIYSINTPRLYYTIQTNNNIEIPQNKINQQKIYKLEGEDTDIIMKYVNTKNDNFLETNLIYNSGNYKLIQADKILNNISFNFNRQESNTDSYSLITLKENNPNIDIWQTDSSYIKQKINNTKTDIYWLFILFSIIFISIEILLIKIFKS